MKKYDSVDAVFIVLISMIIGAFITTVITARCIDSNYEYAPLMESLWKIAIEK